MTDPKLNDVYVQILPVIKVESSNKILLCKWTKGDFKDRFTGLIKAVDFKVISCTINTNLQFFLKNVLDNRSPRTIPHFEKNSKT